MNPNAAPAAEPNVTLPVNPSSPRAVPAAPVVSFFEGGSALSEFRARQLLPRLQAVEPRIEGIRFIGGGKRFLGRFQLFRHLKALQEDWALVEFDLPVEIEGMILELYLEHDVLRNAEFTADELLIRSRSLDVWQSSGPTLLHNGRTFVRRQGM